VREIQSQVERARHVGYGNFRERRFSTGPLPYSRNMNAPKSVLWARDQITHARSVWQSDGWRAVVGDRIAASLRSSPSWRADRAVSEHELAASRNDIEAETAALRQRVALLEQRRQDDEVERRALHNEISVARDRLDDTRAALDDWLWWTNAPLASRPLVTAVIATGHAERANYLRAAVESIIAQTYSKWELFVCDDTPDLALAPQVRAWWPDDARITVIEAGASDQRRARNLALDAGRGSIVAYLDDDCRWYPWWLHALVATFEDPGVDAAYGVRIVENDSGGAPHSFVTAFDALELHRRNPADTNIAAHRARLAGARWTGELRSCSDYEFALQLSEHRWRFVPVPAAAYSTTSPKRKWAREEHAANWKDMAVIGRRARRTRPLRIVGHNSLYPLITETYIGDELEALRRNGIDIVLSRNEPAVVPTPSRIDVPLFESLQHAIEAHDPDLVLAHWAGTAIEMRPACAAADVPYAARTHSFDGGISAEELIDDRCIGAWTHPHRDMSHPRVFPLRTLIVDPSPDTVIGGRSTSVLMATAGLPKRGWPTLMAAVADLPDVTLDVIVGRTNGHEMIADRIMEAADAEGLSPTVRCDVDYEVVQQAMRTHGALVYSLNPGEHIGQPRSVIEGAIAGIPLVLPEHPAMRGVVGNDAHFYERGDRASLATALRAAIDRPIPASDRLALADRIRREHSSPEVLEAWANSLTDAFLQWRHDMRTDHAGRLIRWWQTVS
jgi:hypothetical protein